jgi:diadenosine tetraphosphatase ApaH/serine/threonine PP2A family protein phosphatase
MIQEDDKIILHAEHTIQLSDNNFYLINVGSIGQPRDFDSRSCYALYDTDAKEISLIRVQYDFAITQRKILDNNLPAFLAQRLEKGK